jgi:hypothetical protein
LPGQEKGQQTDDRNSMSDALHLHTWQR